MVATPSLPPVLQADELLAAAADDPAPDIRPQRHRYPVRGRSIAALRRCRCVVRADGEDGVVPRVARVDTARSNCDHVPPDHCGYREHGPPRWWRPGFR